MLGNCLLVGIGGFAGAIGRYAVTRWLGQKGSGRVPRGTLFVNLTGSFLLGWLVGSGAGHEAQLLIGTGFMGAYTTFSTFHYESLQFGLQRAWAPLVMYLGISASLGILLAYAGFWLGGTGAG
ncbi:CrcB family protein [Paenibacillus sp. CC-CFT747]|nr:CrcB family protein [Paenibacillus sp. CC-CFT747]